MDGSDDNQRMQKRQTPQNQMAKGFPYAFSFVAWRVGTLLFVVSLI